MSRVVVPMLVTTLAVLVAPAARAQSPEIAPEQWKSLAKAVRIVKCDYVAAIDDARLAAGCADRVHGLYWTAIDLAAALLPPNAVIVKKVLGPPNNEVAWARNEGVLRQAPEGASRSTSW